MEEKRKPMITIFIGIIACIIVFAVLVYPGVYEYDKIEQRLPVKINRFTGQTKILTTDGWYTVDDVESVETETSPTQ